MDTDNFQSLYRISLMYYQTMTLSRYTQIFMTTLRQCATNASYPGLLKYGYKTR